MSCNINIPMVTLNNCNKIPTLGLGTWQAAPGIIQNVIKEAIKIGYRHIDCAFIYGNENEIGDAIQEAIAEGLVKREDLFITSKLWNTCHNTKVVVPTCKNSLKKLKLDYLDLYLIHWPVGYKEDASNEGELFPVDENGQILSSDVDYVDTWKGMEQCFKLGLAKNIGISNFNSEQITRILSKATIKPVINQIEVHPMLNQKKLIAFCQSNDIQVTAYSPFGSPKRVWFKPGDPILDLNDERLIEIGNKYNKAPTQVILRYLIQIGTVPIPKTENIERLKSNFDVFDFHLTSEDIAIIDRFNCDARICSAEEMKSHKYYPFHIEF